MKTLISIDPGLSTGIAVGTYSDTESFKLTHVFQIEGGVEGLIQNFKFYYESYCHHLQVGRGRGALRMSRPQGGFEVLVEKFNARGSANSGFSYTSKSLEPLRVEGALIAMGVPITWVQPPQQYFLPGSSKAEKKKRQHAWLKENGYYIAPKEVNETPELAKKNKADDARSALAHAISWLRRQKHVPTLSLFREKEDNNA